MKWECLKIPSLEVCDSNLSCEMVSGGYERRKGLNCTLDRSSLVAYKAVKVVSGGYEKGESA